MMGTEIFNFDASLAEKLTKTRVSFLTAPTVIQMIFCRGLKDPEGAKRRMETKAAAAAEMEGGGGGMKWQVN